MVHMCVCVCVHADVSVNVYACVRVCMHACMRVSVLCVCVCVWVWVCLTYSTNSHEISVLRMIGGTVDQALMRAESGTVPIRTMQRRRIGQEWKHASGDQLISVTGFKGCAAGLQVKRIVCGAGTGVKSQSQHLLNLGVRSSVTV